MVLGSISNCTCGIKGGRSRIVGGQEASIKEYPWMVSLRYLPWSYNKNWCGASLISDRWILSAFHCLQDRDNASDWRAFLGEHDYDTNNETDHIDMAIVQIISHPEYRDYSFNDIALLKMEKSLDFLQHPGIRPICLPENAENSYLGETAIITGWGNTRYNGFPSNVLLEVSIPVISYEECEPIYGSNHVKNTQVCYLEKGKSSCNGDSGK